MHWFPYHADVPRGDCFGFDYRAGHFHETGERMDTHFVKEHRAWQKQLLDEWTAHGIGKGGDGCTEAFLGYASAHPGHQHADWWSAGKAAEFIEAKRSQSFLLVSSLIMPHAPHAVPSDFAELYDSASVPLPPEAPEGIPPLHWLAGIFLVVSLLGSALQFLDTVVLSLTGQAAMRDLRRAVFDHIQRLHLGFFDRFEISPL